MPASFPYLANALKYIKRAIQNYASEVAPNTIKSGEKNLMHYANLPMIYLTLEINSSWGKLTSLFGKDACVIKRSALLSAWQMHLWMCPDVDGSQGRSGVCFP